MAGLLRWQFYGHARIVGASAAGITPGGDWKLVRSLLSLW